MATPASVSESAFFEAVEDRTADSFEELRDLLDQGIDPNIRNGNDSTALHLLADMTWGERICKKAQLLIDRGADVNARDETQKTPLHLATLWQNSRMEEVLVEAGADRDARDMYEMTAEDWRHFDGGGFF